MGSGLVLGTGSGGGGGAPTDAQYVVLVANATLTQERILAGSASEIVVTDAGAGAAVTLTAGALIVQTDQANTWTVGSQIIETAADTLTAFQVIDSAARTVLVADTTNARLGIGKANPVAGIDLLDDSYAPGIAGGMRMSASTVIGTQVGIFAIRHYNPANVDVLVYYGVSYSLGNAINFGGGGTLTVATQIYFHTALTTTTVGSSPRLGIQKQGYVGIGGVVTAPQAMLHVQPNLTTAPGVIIQGAASQTASLFQLQDSTTGVVADSGDGLAGSEFVFNQGGIDIDFRVESLTYDAINVDAGSDELELMKNAAGLIGFFAAAPVNQRAKANFNNWAAFTDVVDALVSLGLFDAA